MAILDSRLEFMDAFTFTSGGTGAIATAAAGNIVDLTPNGAPTGGVDIGVGKPLFLVIRVLTALTQTGTFNLQLVSDTAENLTTSPTVHWSLGTVTNAGAPLNAAGTVLVQALPSGAYKRYLGLKTTIATGAVSAGVLDAFLTMEPHLYKAYPDAAN